MSGDRPYINNGEREREAFPETAKAIERSLKNRPRPWAGIDVV